MAHTGRPETPLRSRFLAKFAFDSNTGCWIWTGARHPQGYGLIKLKDGAQLRAHRVAYELAHGPIPDGLQVCHRCDNRRCVRPGHLFLGTAKDNAADMVAKGRAARNTGERNGASRLTRQDIEAIRADDSLYRELASRFRVSPSAIGLIKRRERWKHV
ncbi:HNH endonuclease signature motif containing protein [Sulfuritortus calidifontis]|uniref:HNH endonuclease signature motif containing protein n=1 Tax=Sulfuritortus calidifontis TaxID=1914471 RepID=UPI000F82320F|nr:HNH endonuclease signature motif containing protein [Sulfuritortus calidifontis]